MKTCFAPEKIEKKCWKKWILPTLCAIALLFASEHAASAASAVGFFDSQKTLFQHPHFDDTTRILLFLSRPMAEDQMVLINQEKDADERRLFGKYMDLIQEFIEIDRAIRNEKDPERKKLIEEDRQTRLTQEEEEMMAPILEECQRALDAVASAKKITLVVEAGYVYLGGTDLTQDIIREMERNVK